MPDDHFIVIGNGPAGSQAAFTLRERAPDARVTVISREREGCCHSHLLPGYLAGHVTEDQVFAVSLERYKDCNIKLRTGQQAIGIDTDRKLMMLGHNEIIPFTGLVIAVGARPRIPEPLLPFQSCMQTLKTFRDAVAWKDTLANAETILIMGGDLTSLAVTRELRRLDKKIYFMLNSDAFWPLRFSKSLYDEVSQKLVQRGIEVLPGVSVKRIEKLSAFHYRTVIDSRTIESGMVGAFFGLAPDVRFLAGSGLQIDRGILVDEYLCTGIDGIVAAGDCAQVYHPDICDYWVSIGTRNARSLGRTAAANLAGGRETPDISAESIMDVQGIKVNTSWWTEF